VVGNHACGDAFHIRAFCLFLGYLTVLNFLRSAACCFLNEVDVLLTHFHNGARRCRRPGGFFTQMRIGSNARIDLGENGADSAEARCSDRNDRWGQYKFWFH
jgi:hypothetical protein